MISENEKYGLLLNNNIKIHRAYFKEMCGLIGIKVVYRAPQPGKHWTIYTEIESNYQKPEVVDCIFEEHIDQKTMKKLGWDAELVEGEAIISVPYDLEGIQAGALFIIPSGIDCASGRLFRVTQMSTIQIYPASITCRLVPEFENTFSSSQFNYKHSSFNLLNEED